MCNPLLALVAVSSVLQVTSMVQQSRAQDAAFDANKRNSIRAAMDAYQAQAVQANQSRAAAGQASLRNTLAAARARATAEAGAADAGIAGVSVDNILADVTRQEGNNYADIAANEAFAADRRALQGQGIQTTGAGRINSVSGGGFNPIIGLLQIGADVGGAYYGQKADQPKPGT
jgi:hypothetical protein